MQTLSSNFQTLQIKWEVKYVVKEVLLASFIPASLSLCRCDAVDDYTTEEPSLSGYLLIAWRENNWIHTFLKRVSAMWNAISLVQDLNSCRRVHFLRQ